MTLQESVHPDTMGVSMSLSINYGTRCTFPLGLFKDPFHFRPPSSAQLDTSAMVDAAVEVALEALGLVCAPLSPGQAERGDTHAQRHREEDHLQWGEALALGPGRRLLVPTRHAMPF